MNFEEEFDKIKEKAKEYMFKMFIHGFRCAERNYWVDLSRISNKDELYFQVGGMKFDEEAIEAYINKDLWKDDDDLMEIAEWALETLEESKDGRVE